MFREVVSEAKTDRRQLRGALIQLAEGNVLMVTRIDRLTRSRIDIPAIGTFPKERLRTHSAAKKIPPSKK